MMTCKILGSSLRTKISWTYEWWMNDLWMKSYELTYEWSQWTLRKGHLTDEPRITHFPGFPLFISRPGGSPFKQFLRGLYIVEGSSEFARVCINPHADVYHPYPVGICTWNRRNPKLAAQITQKIEPKTVAQLVSPLSHEWHEKDTSTWYIQEKLASCGSGRWRNAISDRCCQATTRTVNSECS